MTGALLIQPRTMTGDFWLGKIWLIDVNCLGLPQLKYVKIENMSWSMFELLSWAKSLLRMFEKDRFQSGGVYGIVNDSEF